MSIRSPFEVTSTEIAALNADELTHVVNVLLRIEANVVGIMPTDVHTSLRVLAPDEGVDAYVRAHDLSSRWISKGDSVWQYKAGSPPNQADIREELEKPGVVNAVKNGASYVLVLGADLKSRARQNRENWLAEGVAGITADASVVLVAASDLAEWVTKYPALLFHFRRPVAGVWPLDDWVRTQPRHRTPFQADDDRTKKMETLRQSSERTDGPIHIRLQGPSGVGKTRLVLESFRDMAESVLYAPQVPSDKLKDLFSWMAVHTSAHAVLVIDECDATTALQMEADAEMSNGRLHLVTVGHASSPSHEANILDVDPLDEAMMERVVLATVSTLSPEQSKWIVRVSRGYPRLAIIIAEQVAQGIVNSAVEAVSKYSVQQILLGILPDSRVRRALSGLALLTRVGWDDDLEPEGRVVASFVGIQWEEMREIVGQKVLGGIISKQGRYRYITPEILAIWLAAEEWRSRGRDILKLLSDLPTDESRKALTERIGMLGGLPEVSDVVGGLLGSEGPFTQIAALNDAQNSNLFRILAQTSPLAALRTLERLVLPASDSELLGFVAGRRNIVWTLERLVRWKDTFFGAARVLRRLAETENETWANNATGIWRNLFLTYLGQTEVPATDRYVLIEEALDSQSRRTGELGVLALERALTVQETGSMVGEDRGGLVPPASWRPRNAKEDHDCRRAALRLLDKALNAADEHVGGLARKALIESFWGMTRIGLADEVINRVEQLEVQSEKERRQLWETLQRILKFEASGLSDEQQQRLEQLSKALYGDSFLDRLHRYVGRFSYTDFADLSPDHPEAFEARLTSAAASMAEEAMVNQSLLLDELEWLTSGEAENVWPFAVRLGKLDAEHGLLEPILNAAAQGKDPRLLSGYLSGRSGAGDTKWVNYLLDDWAKNPTLAAIVFDATWRGTPSNRGVDRLVELVDEDRLEPSNLAALVYGGWVRELPETKVRKILDRLIKARTPQATEAGLAMTMQWTGANGGAIPPALSRVVWKLLEGPAGENASTMLSFYWQHVAQMLLRSDPVRVARSVIRLIAEDRVSFGDERIGVLRSALKLEPQAVWEVFAEVLLQNPRTAFLAHLRLSDANLLDDLDSSVLLEWASKQPSKRPQLLAQMIKPREVITPLLRGLLATYGAESSAARALHANFLSGMWWGSHAAHEEQLLDTAAKWLADSDPNVRAWARKIVEGIEKRLPRLRMEEEEETP